MDVASLPERVRAFIALRLDAAVEAEIASLSARLRAPGDGIRWVRASHFHLTLFFLGPAVARERIPPIAEALGAIAAESAPFEVEARGTGAFPGLARPRVLWVGLHGPELLRLAARVAEAAERCGFERERRRYSAHLTIARVRKHRAWRAIRRAFEQDAERGFGVSRIERIVLYRSELGPESSTYYEIAGFPLGVRY